MTVRVLADAVKVDRMNAALLAAQLDEALHRPIMPVGFAIMHGEAAQVEALMHRDNSLRNTGTATNCVKMVQVAMHGKIWRELSGSMAGPRPHLCDSGTAGWTEDGRGKCQRSQTARPSPRLADRMDRHCACSNTVRRTSVKSEETATLLYSDTVPMHISMVIHSQTCSSFAPVSVIGVH